MADPRQRRSPRVAYSAPVRLSGEWSDREPWFVPLLAQSLDLSEGGMALVTPLHLRLGAAVTCSMRLGGQQAYFVGRVVWDRLAPDGTKRVGIEFQSPSDQETGLMRRLLAIGQSHPHRVNLRFDGRPDTMTALARVTNSGLALSAPLPILRRDTPVRFAFEGIGPTFEGRVDRVRLAHLQGMPALRVAIRVDQAQHTSAGPRAAHGAATDAREDAT
ncbi:MAG TPA: PilZ domain-containing protein, partial [Polyangiales bacterium]|nr:PilZ domain-containing protein [Polyangiales bacterium]